MVPPETENTVYLLNNLLKDTTIYDNIQELRHLYFYTFHFFTRHNYFLQRICIIGSAKKIEIDLPVISQ